MRSGPTPVGNVSDWGTRAFLVTSALSVARELWRYGEPDLAARALTLPPDSILELGVRAMRLLESGDGERLWPGGPKGKALILAAIQWLEGASRPALRRRRLPERDLPAELQATDMELFRAAKPVRDAVLARSRFLGSA